MYLALTRIGQFFRDLNPVVTASIALMWALSYILLTLLGINAQYDLFYKVLALLPATAFLLWAGVKYLSRRSQLGRKDHKYITNYFRTSEQFSQIFDHSIQIEKGCLKLLKRLKAKDNYKWPENEAELTKISAINATAFRGTPWAGSEQEKLERNLTMWHNNPQSFLMIMDDSQDQDQNTETQPLFFSHILPLSDHGYHHYFETAESGDNEFNPNWMAKDGTTVKGLLLFTIARDPDNKENKKKLSENKMPDYLCAMAYHIQTILDHYPDQPFTTLYFQNSDKKFKRLAELAGFKKSRLLTHDEEIVYVTSVDNSAASA